MRIALIGNPNSGKTTMFNDLCGTNQYVGNWPGVTVEKKEGKLIKDKSVKLIDLPGIYSLSPYTLEEKVARDFLVDEKPDAIINIVDATNLERNLYLTTQVMEMGIPVVVALNMMDDIKKDGKTIDVDRLEAIYGIRFIKTSAIKGDGLGELASTAIALGGGQVPKAIKFSSCLEEALSEIASLTGLDIKDDRYRIIKIFERDYEGAHLDNNLIPQVEKIIKKSEEIFDDDAEAIIIDERYHFIEKNMSGIVKSKVEKGMSTTMKIDKVLTNKFLALPIFLAIMWAIYYISISIVGDGTVGYIEGFFESVGNGVEAFLLERGASDWIVSLINGGIIQSLGAIFTFVPQLLSLFFFLSVLEDTGYMARIAFIMDRMFRKFGLSGRSFIPILLGTGCSIPGIMATRTIKNDADRRMTILLTPFIPCGAKLPIFAMFISLIFNGSAFIGPLIYLIAIVVIIISGLILKRTKRFQGEASDFVMELPRYRIPSLKTTLLHMFEKAKAFVVKAGTIIFLSCVVIWILQNFTFSLEYIGEGEGVSILEAIGNKIRYIFIPLGFGDSWAPAVATVSGLLAKEVVVTSFASMSQKVDIYFSAVSAFSFIIFIMFASPCAAAIGAMREEYRNKKDLLFAICFQTGLAYVLSFLTYNIGNLIFRNTNLVVPKILDNSLIEAAGEGEVGANYTLLLIASVIIISLITTIVVSVIRKNKYSKKVTA